MLVIKLKYGSTSYWLVVSLLLLTSAAYDFDEKRDLLEYITSLPSKCSPTNPFPVAPFRLDVSIFDQTQQKVDLLSSIIERQKVLGNHLLYSSMAKEMLSAEAMIYEIRIARRNFNILVEGKGVNIKLRRGKRKKNLKNVDEFEWIEDSVELSLSDFLNDSFVFDPHRYNNVKSLHHRGKWTYPYRSCSGAKWLISYTVLLHSNESQPNDLRTMFSIDMDISSFDINQCNDIIVNKQENKKIVINNFRSTHRCNESSSECKFVENHGWAKSGYQCICRKGYYSSFGSSIINGTIIEAAHKATNDPNINFNFNLVPTFKKCKAGCDQCQDDAPCLSSYNWIFRISLLTICMICILMTFILIVYVYNYRKIKVFKVSSPIFLYITLIGAIIMYTEMAAIFPVLDMYGCIATKWTRHLGFCITYSALLLKTWRVSLTYRVKSAHKLKLTDKQLLQWLFPILLVIVIYLSTWTLSTPPRAIYVKDWYELKFKQCEYGWWDHSLAIGEFIFLLWGIKVCYNVRNAESLFNEAKYITWAVYNIALVNLVMVGLHLVFLPDATPDMKYLFGFVRTQISTTITIILIFGPKFYRLMKGQGDTWDTTSRPYGVTTFALNGVGLMNEDTTDLYQENEELKEEIQKLAAQMEFMKIVHMEMNNRHVKPKHGGVFNMAPSTNQSSASFNQSSSVRQVPTSAVYAKFDSADSINARISPAAELASERV